MINNDFNNLEREYEKLFKEHKIIYNKKDNIPLYYFFKSFEKEQSKLLTKLKLKIKHYNEILKEIDSIDEAQYHISTINDSLNYLKDDLKIYESYINLEDEDVSEIKEHIKDIRNIIKDIEN